MLIFEENKMFGFFREKFFLFGLVIDILEFIFKDVKYKLIGSII